MGIVEVDPTDIPLGEDTVGEGGSGNVGAPTGKAGGVGTGGSQPSGAMRVGKPCETSSDCPTGQTCHMDPDFISHKQCTLDCDSGATCEALEKTSFCIGAHVCVHACDSDADCGPKTRCGTAGWCERSGPGSGVAYCGGVATPCSLLSGSSCGLSFGCRDNSACSGVAESCYSQSSSFSCTSQDGCFWSSSSSDCSGSAHSCLGYAFELECSLQDGCSWQSSCSGIPQSCENTPVALCANQPGCSLVND